MHRNPPTQETKTCRDCHKSLPATTEYFFMGRASLAPRCKSCANIMQQRWRRANPDKVRAQKRRARARKPKHPRPPKPPKPVREPRVPKPSRKKRVRRGMVYVVTDHRGHYKIGCAGNPDDRLIELQIGNPFKLSILFLFQCSDMDARERQIQAHFEDKRMMGEWFALDEHDLHALTNFDDEYAPRMGQDADDL